MQPQPVEPGGFDVIPDGIEKALRIVTGRQFEPGRGLRDERVADAVERRAIDRRRDDIAVAQEGPFEVTFGGGRKAHRKSLRKVPLIPYRLRIGIDFDNTIVDYDALFVRTARERGLIGPGVAGGKQGVRDAIRSGSGGEAAWMLLQADVYGALIEGAPAFAGVHDFVRTARAQGAELFVVSHKTPYAAARPAGVQLHDAARAWLAASGLVGPDALAAGDIYFEPTRERKIARLRSLGVGLAIDDLRDVFEHPDFPPEVERWLFDPHGGATAGPWRVFPSWDAMRAALHR
jgi:hypothetical protein